VLFDSNIIIYLTEETALYHDLSLELFFMIEQGSASAVISILTVAEVMSGPLRAGKSDVAMIVKNYLMNFPNIHCQQTTAGVLDMVGRDEREVVRMYDIEGLKQEVLERLRCIDPEQIVLFGSYTHGRPGQDSDIDLYVVTKDNFIPQSYKEKRERLLDSR